MRLGALRAIDIDRVGPHARRRTGGKLGDIRGGRRDNERASPPLPRPY